MARESLSTFIIRWDQLYKEMLEFVIPNAEDDEALLAQADDIIADRLEELNRTSKYCYKTTEIARQYRMSASDMLSFLTDKKIVHKVNWHYELTRQYRNKGLEEYFYSMRYNSKGKRVLKKTIVWTDEGKRFIQKFIH
jgi:phage antirepressor YoqD-like protein